jgi:hypothetical protein
LSPSSGSTGGGTSIALTGSNFTGATVVLFGATAATSFQVNSDSSITAIAPAHVAGGVDVTVVTPGGVSAIGAADQFTFQVVAPTVTGISPASGPTGGGTSVTITGTNLTGATGVSFGATPATSFVINSINSITAVAPANAAGAVDVTVTTPGGTSATSTADHFIYQVLAPTVTGLTPATGSTGGGNTITIIGTNLTGATGVSFGGTPAASFHINSPTSITAITPVHSAGAFDVTVTTAGGTSAVSTADRFTFQAILPTITSVSPASGSTAGGASITITGTGLGDVTAVSFGGIAATSFTIVSPSSLTAIAPAHAAGNASVSVVSPQSTICPGHSPP